MTGPVAPAEVERHPETFDRFEALVAVMARLRDAAGGCPWDKRQTWATLRPYLLEEAHELAHALGAGDDSAVAEEIGDVLFECVFLARVAEEEGRFRIGDAIRAVVEKLIRRHPHVFGDRPTDDPDEIQRRWQQIKAAERAAKAAAAAARGEVHRPPSLLDGVPPALPALLAALRLGERAATVGFDWPSAEAALAKIDEEAAELRAAVASGRRAAIVEEGGDLLFAAANALRLAGVNPEDALAAALDKFRARFGRMEAAAAAEGVPLAAHDAAAWDARWIAAKGAEAAPLGG